LRGLLLLGQLGIEGELVASPIIRDACADSGIGIVYFEPHLDATFICWREGFDSGDRLLAALAALAARSGQSAVSRVPWITAGHSTAGIFCRNVAYWRPDRVAAVVHIKSGNFFQADLIPPAGRTLAGIPLVCINGQLETFGPSADQIEVPGAERPDQDRRYGRQTQWIYARNHLLRYRAADGEQLMSMFVHLGDDHFHGAPELEWYVAGFLRQTAAHRLPEVLPAGDGPVPPRTVRAADGWLTDSDLENPRHPPAAAADYAGDRAQAFWHYDEQTARANAAWHARMGRHQVIDSPQLTWLDEGDGWTCRATATFLEAWPDKFGGTLVGGALTHAPGPIVFRAKATQPVTQTGPDTFHLSACIRDRKGNASVDIAAFHPGDEGHRATTRWGTLAVPPPGKDAVAQTIAFPPPAGPFSAAGAPLPLGATATSGLPVHYTVELGPARVEDGRLVVVDLPPAPRYPIPVRVTAHQGGRRLATAAGPAVASAAPLTITVGLVP
jgi:hypothetical protein